MNKKKILFITYYFPPIKAIGSIRPYNFVKYFNLNNWDTTVITTSAYKILDKDNFFRKLKKTKYIYIPTFDLQVIRKIFNLRKNNNTQQINTESEISDMSFSKKIRNSFPFNLSYEGGVIYIFFGIIFGIYNVKKNKIKYIYSTFSPNANHVIAYYIKIFCPTTYWIADFRDLPFGDSDSELFMKNFQLKINEKIYTKSDMIITVSDGLKNNINKYNNNIHVITNGCDFNVNKLLYNQKKTDFFNIVYTGDLYNGKRNADLLFRIVKKLIDNGFNKIRLIYAGNDGIIWNYWVNKYELNEYCTTYDFLDTEQVFKLQSEASINLMLTWSSKNEKGILTGKFYEYLFHQKPIICIINGKDDIEINNIFNSLNCGIVVNYNENILSKFLNKYYVQWQEDKSTNIVYNKKELNKYTSKYLTQQLENILFGIKYK